jgi:hypothetical protein
MQNMSIVNKKSPLVFSIERLRALAAAAVLPETADVVFASNEVKQQPALVWTDAVFCDTDVNRPTRVCIAAPC